jgi:hypothetical protein
MIIWLMLAELGIFRKLRFMEKARRTSCPAKFTGISRQNATSPRPELNITLPMTVLER